MNLRLVVSLIALGVVCITGCRTAHALHSVPVVASPTSPTDEEALRKAIQGEGWKIDHTIYEDGAEESEAGWFYMEFGPTDSFVYRINGRPQEFKYSVEGKNVVTTHPGVKTLRVDSVTGNEMRVFVYEMGLTWVLKR